MKTITVTDDDATVEARARAIALDEKTYDPDEMIDLVPGVFIDGEEVVPFWKLFKSKAEATLEADRKRAVDEATVEARGERILRDASEAFRQQGAFLADAGKPLKADFVQCMLESYAAQFDVLRATLEADRKRAVDDGVLVGALERIEEQAVCVNMDGDKGNERMLREIAETARSALAAIKGEG